MAVPADCHLFAETGKRCCGGEFEVKLVTAEEILSPEAYAPVREQRRQEVRAIKDRRRLHIGDRVTIYFENHDTMAYQIQEMVRAENMHEPEKIQEEVEIYNDLVPQGNQLCATMFIEITEQSQIPVILGELVGIENHVALMIGEERVAATPDEDLTRTDKTASVHYLKFNLNEVHAEAIRNGSAPLRLVIDHPRYTESATVPETLRQELAQDLA
ncbi:MAG: DUF3501 family protein [Firmicutes bacterium]|nr:DUF3501 family protein [Bacillota bacterium]